MLAADRRPPYVAGMSSTDRDAFDPVAVAASHRHLLELAAATRADDLQAVLNLGAAVLLHAALEPAHLRRVLALIDPAVLEELQDQHVQLEHDLRFLRELAEGDPHSEDLELMTSAVLERIRSHIERDQRTLYGPMARLHDLEASRESGGPDAVPGEA